MKLTKKEKEQILKNWAEAMSKIIERMSIEMWELEEENKKLKEERDLYKARNEELNEDCFWLAKENKNLKSDLAFERTMLDNVKAEYESSQEIIKKLKEEIKWWKDLVHKAKEFEYDEDGMDYIWQNTKI